MPRKRTDPFSVSQPHIFSVAILTPHSFANGSRSKSTFPRFPGRTGSCPDG